MSYGLWSERPQTKKLKAQLKKAKNQTVKEIEQKAQLMQDMKRLRVRLATAGIEAVITTQERGQTVRLSVAVRLNQRALMFKRADYLLNNLEYIVHTLALGLRNKASAK